MEHSPSQAPQNLPFITIGTARLPKAIAGEKPGALMIEFTLDSEDGPIVDVATTVPLPGYAALLRGLFVGRRWGEVAGAVEKLSAHLRGPLLRPTIAALVSAVSQSQQSAPT